MRREAQRCLTALVPFARANKKTGCATVGSPATARRVRRPTRKSAISIDACLIVSDRFAIGVQKRSLMKAGLLGTLSRGFRLGWLVGKTALRRDRRRLRLVLLRLLGGGRCWSGGDRRWIERQRTRRRRRVTVRTVRAVVLILIGPLWWSSNHVAADFRGRVSLQWPRAWRPPPRASPARRHTPPKQSNSAYDSLLVSRKA